MTTFTQVETSFNKKAPVTGRVGLDRRRRRRRGFTLIELLVVITIIGILIGLIIGPLGGFLWNTEKTKTIAKFKDYEIALAQFQSANGGSFPGLFNSEDPVNLSDPDVRDKFLMALKGKKLVNDQWIDLETQEAKKYNPTRQQFYDFDEDEFDEDGNLVDAWGNPAIKIIVDWDGDGFIQLPTDSEVEQLNGDRIQKDVVIYVLSKDDPDGDGGGDVFSWDD